MNRERELNRVAEQKQKGIHSPYYFKEPNNIKFRPRQVPDSYIHTDRTHLPLEKLV